MNARTLHRRLAPLLLLLASAGASAEDIDLFAGDSDITSIPNVLFVFDNSANWNASIGDYKKYEMLHEAFYGVMTFSGLADQMNVGMMGFADGNSPRGGKIISAVQPLTAAHQAELACRLYKNDDGGCVVTRGDEALPQANNAPYALSLDEAYLYFRGSPPMSGLQDGAYDATGNPGGYDPAAISGGSYVSPIDGNGCGKNFVILIGNGSPDNGENSAAETRLISRGGKLMNDPIDLSPDNNYQSNWGDEYARFLASTDLYSGQAGVQSLTTYVIDIFDPNSSNNKPFRSERAFLKSIAAQGKGRYFDVSTANEIRDALLDILNEIQSVNSVFASTTLPVSVNVRGTNLNQVYMGVFRPDATSLPRWYGNLKLYRLAVDEASNATYLADRNGNEATSGTTGFINHTSLSYWTSASSFWEDSPRGTPPSADDSPDGAEVEKGGAAQHIRTNAIANGVAARNLYTCTSGTGRCTGNSLLSAAPFSDGNSAISQSDLGVATSTERTNLINWARGANINALDAIDGFSSSTVRPSVHGDVLHSRPVVVNYNRHDNDDDVVAFYGSNDGFLHAVKGGMAASGGVAAGTELWGFIPREFFGKLKRSYDLSPKILTPDNGTLTPTPLPKEYFADGSIGVYQLDVNNDGILRASDGDKVYIYLSMRRGGRLLYALDVSDPAAPKFLWAIDNTTTGFTELGYTWSAPKVAKIYADLDNDGTNEVTPVVIFGGGYDPGKDDERASTPNNTAQRLSGRSMGRAIYIVNAETGDRIAYARPITEDGGVLAFSVPSDVTVINNHQGYASKLYVGDTGANLWKIDISSTNRSNWTISRLAALSGTNSPNFRKFLYPPDVVGTNDGYDAILIGSGDREDPFDGTTVNRFYMVKDNGSNINVTESNLYNATGNLIQQGTDDEKSAAATALADAKGWYITLRTGEKVISSAITLSGTTFFNTNIPAASADGSCTPNLGKAYIYMLAFKDARAVADRDGESGLTASDRAGNEVPGGGLLPSPVPIVYQDDDGKKRETVCAGTQCVEPPGTPFDVRRRSYFYKQFE